MRWLTNNFGLKTLALVFASTLSAYVYYEINYPVPDVLYLTLRAEGLDPDVAAELQAKEDTLFKGESLRAMLLNAYGWWTVATIALWAGFAIVIAGLILGIFSILGFWHAGRAQAKSVERRVTTPEYVGASS